MVDARRRPVKEASAASAGRAGPRDHDDDDDDDHAQAHEGTRLW